MVAVYDGWVAITVKQIYNNSQQKKNNINKGKTGLNLMFSVPLLAWLMTDILPVCVFLMVFLYLFDTQENVGLYAMQYYDKYSSPYEISKLIVQYVIKIKWNLLTENHINEGRCFAHLSPKKSRLVPFGVCMKINERDDI